MPITFSMHVTELEAREWSRLATDAYRLGLNATGHKFSMAAACYWGKDMPLQRYDELQAEYRSWLIAGFPGYENETIGARARRGVDVSSDVAAYRRSMESK